ncbi:MAG: hypothetical protein BWY32_00896 [bacterium ADurb.Bin243]|nr:MAG: hypothetical protein BWY32_00896 [bacterium ADurb.Bin243]
MKTYRYKWTPEYYLLHLQFNNPQHKVFEAVVTRNFVNGSTRVEKEIVKDGVDSHRILISRSHPKETDLVVEYPDSLVLEIFELDDRAYYPVEPIYKG